MTNHRPEFATNRMSSATPQTVADGLNDLLSGLSDQLKEPPKLAIASAYFNVAGFERLADQLDRVGDVRLLLGAEPTDAAVRTTITPLRVRKSYSGDPRQRDATDRHESAMREDRDLVGFTRDGDAGARRLVNWLRNHGVEVRRLESDFLHGKAYIATGGHPSVIAGSSNFTFAGLTTNRELNLGVYQPGVVNQVVQWFDEQWADAVDYDLAGLYSKRWEAHRPWDVFLRMLYERYGAELDEDQSSAHELTLTQFQRDGVRRAKRILAQRRGVIIADEVGLGKTFIAGELIRAAAIDNRQKVLIIASATLRDSTWEPFKNSFNLPAQVISYDELVRELGTAPGASRKIQDPNEYALVVVDEAHNLRNSVTLRADAMRRLLGGTVPKNLVLMTATPVNNSLEDLATLVSYITPVDSAFADIGIPSVHKYIGDAMAMNPDELSGKHLFDLLDAIAVRRTRRFIKTHYPNARIRLGGIETVVTFPQPVVKRVEYRLDEHLPGFFDKLARALGAESDDDDFGRTGVILSDKGTVLTMARYVPSRFALGQSKVEQYQVQNAGLLRSGLLKRFESSSVAFAATLTKMIASHENFLSALADGWVLTGDALRSWVASDSDDVESVVAGLDTESRANAQSAGGYDLTALREAVEADRDLMKDLRRDVGTPDHRADPKVAALIKEIEDVVAQAGAEGLSADDIRNRRKVLIFTYFADTAAYLHQALAERATTESSMSGFLDRIVLATGSDRNQRQDAIVGFAPKTAGAPGLPPEADRYDIAVATDVLSEGVNLQQARHIINYDLPWNPMRLVQRYGRVDRIGSPHTHVYLRCFFPDRDLERLLNLEQRLQLKLKQAAAAFGTSEVLPGLESVERVMAETRDEIDKLYRGDASAFQDSGSASASSEEFQRRLSRTFESDVERQAILALPWGSGTGMIVAGAEPGVVFCARIADHHRPFFRYVPLHKSTLTPRVSTEGPELSRQLLTCLDVADPRDPDRAANLPDNLREAAFDGWTIAQQDIFSEWMALTDPAVLQTPVPKVMRDAADLVRRAGALLAEQQDRLVRRLNQATDNRIQRQVRTMLMSSSDDAQTARALLALADDLRLRAPEPVEPHPEIELDDVRLVVWMAIHSQAE